MIFEFEESATQNARMKVVGVGGGGGNAVNHMLNANIEGVDFVVPDPHLVRLLQEQRSHHERDRGNGDRIVEASVDVPRGRDHVKADQRQHFPPGARIEMLRQGGQAARFGAEERRMLHSERYICAGEGPPLGAIVVHAVPDYRTLSFITSQSPYFEVFRTQGGAPPEGMTGSDVEIVVKPRSAAVRSSDSSGCPGQSKYVDDVAPPCTATITGTVASVPSPAAA